MLNELQVEQDEVVIQVHLGFESQEVPIEKLDGALLLDFLLLVVNFVHQVIFTDPFKTIAPLRSAFVL